MRLRTSLLALVPIVVLGTVVVANAAIDDSPSTALVSTTPCRLIDTRPIAAVGSRTSPLGPAETVDFAGHGEHGECTVPDTATALSANVTMLSGTSRSFLTVFAQGNERPSVSSQNWEASAAPAPNAVIIPLSPTGEFSLYNDSGNVHAIVDINGFYVPVDGGAPGEQGPPGEPGLPGAPGEPGEDAEHVNLYASVRGSAAVPSFVQTRLDIAPLFDGLDIDVGGFHDGADTTGLIAPANGVYRIEATVRVDAVTSGFRRLLIEVATPGRNLVRQVDLDESGTATVILSGGNLFEVQAGDTIAVRVHQTSDGDVMASMNSLSVEYLGPLS